MLRSLGRINPVIQLSSDVFTTLQSVRYVRRPKWVPIPKSKLFRVPTRPVVPAVENEEIKRLFNNYRTTVKSIRRYLITKQTMASKQIVDPELMRQAFEEDFNKCNTINDAWNAQVKEARLARFEQYLEDEVQVARTRLEERTKLLQERFEASEQRVRELKAVAHTFITRENIDEAIEKALSGVVDHNFAIDKEGNKIDGRDTKVEPVQVKESVKQ